MLDYLQSTTDKYALLPQKTTSFDKISYINTDRLQPNVSDSLPGSATLHAWQQLAQPHMGALLDHRPGVVTKGFRTLAHEQEQQERDSWQLDQPEEDELLCDSFGGLSGSSCSPVDLPRSTSSPSAHRNQDGDDCSQTETRTRAKDGHVENVPPSSSRPSSSSSPLPSPEMNGHVDLKELQALRAAAMDRTPGEGAVS